MRVRGTTTSSESLWRASFRVAGDSARRAAQRRSRCAGVLRDHHVDASRARRRHLAHTHQGRLGPLAVHLDEQHPAGSRVDRHSGRAHRVERRRVEHLQTARDDTRRDDRAHGGGRRPHLGEERQSGSDAGRLGHQAERGLGEDRERPLAPHQEGGHVVSGDALHRPLPGAHRAAADEGAPRRPSTQSRVAPYLKTRGPPAFSARLPPIMQLASELGSERIEEAPRARRRRGARRSRRRARRRRPGCRPVDVA